MKKGFSLIESVIYIGLLALLLVAIVNMLIVISKSWDSIRMTKNLAYSASTALERMTREIKDADSVNTASSVFNTNPGKLVLNVFGSGGATTTLAFFLSSSTLEIQEASGTTPLILSNTSVSNLVFRHITNAQSEAVKVEMQLNSNYLGASTTANFYVTSVVRGSYQN